MAIKLRDARRRRGWSQSRLIHEIERHARQRGTMVATTASLRVYVSEWENGHRVVSGEYAAILRAVLGLTDDEILGQSPPPSTAADDHGNLAVRVDTARRIGRDMVEALSQQTDLLRTMDRQVGAPGMVDQVQAHLTRLKDILAFAVLSDARRPVAVVLAGTASMAAWQALDVGAAERAWRHYELAKTAAREADDRAHLAHAMGEQAYVLADAGRPALGAQLVQEARRSASRGLSHRLMAWLMAAEAELRALSGQSDECRRLLDEADRELPDGSDSRDGELPNVFLDAWHMTRWRGHTLALLGDDQALGTLYAALEPTDRTFVRAQAGLRCDLAQAHHASGDVDVAVGHLREARSLANRTGSFRHRRRVERMAASLRVR